MAKKTVKKISENITLYEDGKYVWRYDLGLFKTPIIFWLVYRIFILIYLGIALFVTGASLIKGMDSFSKNYLTDLKFLGIGFAVMTAVVVLGYLLYAAIMGGKYCVIFELDEKGVLHKQVPKQAKKARKIAGAAIAAGSIGAGIAASRTTMYTDFSRVKKVKLRPRFDLIKIREGLSHNQVYVHKEDFEFVSNYITEHCKKLSDE